MKILVLSELFYPHGGGAELATWLYLKMLAEEGFRATVVTKRFPGEPEAEDLFNGKVKVFRIQLKAQINGRYNDIINTGILASSFMHKLIRESDVVYLPAGWYSIIPLAKAFKKPVVVHMHNYMIIDPTSLMYDFARNTIGASSLRSFILHELIERRRKPHEAAASAFLNELIGKHYNKLGALADSIIFVSKAQMNLVLSKIPSIKNKSHVIYNPIPDIPFIEAKEKGIGYFGGKSRAKGYHILLRALKTLSNTTSLKAYLTMWNKTGIININKAKIHLLPRVNPKDLMEKLSIVVIPSLCPEPSPYMLIESMLYGKIVIASNTGGIPEIVENAPDVKLVEPGSYRDLIEELETSLTLKLEEINNIGIANREHILRKLNNAKILRSFEEVLNKVTSS